MSETAKPRRWGRRIFFLLLLLAILGVATSLWLDSVAGSRLEAELARVRDAGEPLTLAELVPPPVPDAENAAPLLIEAFELVEDEPEAWFEEHREAYDRYEQNPFETDEAFYDELAAWVTRNRPALDKAREAAARPACRFDLDWEKGIAMETPQVVGMITLSRLLRTQAVLAAREGDVDRAVAICAHQVRLAEISVQDPLLIYLLVRAAVVDVAVRTAQEVLDRGPAATGALRDLAARLDQLSYRGELRRVFVGERTFGYDALSQLLDDPDGVADWTPFDGDLGFGRGLLYHLVPSTMIRLDLARYLALARRAINLTEHPYHEAHDDWDALQAAMRDRPWYAVASSMALVAFPMVVRKWTLHAARVDVARLGLALELHARDHGALPATLADLPGRLTVEDPFRGEPYVWKTTEDGGWVVYAVGPDGKDDGGRPLDDDDEGDIVWRRGATR